MTDLKRRDFLKMGLTAGSLMALGRGSHLISNGSGKIDTEKKFLILGLDGLDPHLINMFMAQGKLPSFSRLRSQGDFRPLRTSYPPQSPVAWSNFITGMNPGGHGIFDFLHRDPETYFPEFSGTKSEGTPKTLSIGNTVFPLSGGKIINLRKGRAFWQILEDFDIPATVFKMPANYPPVPSKQRTLSGMGTPEIQGYPNRFHYFTTEGAEINQDLGGGQVHNVYVIGNRVETVLPGPTNIFKKDQPESQIEFQVVIDPVHPVAKIQIQDHVFMLNQGEWSDWKKVRFKMIPTQSVSGICKFYLQHVGPGSIKLYVSSINIDPEDPALPISTPESYVKELGKKFGSFHTKGFPAESAGLDSGIIDESEFLALEDVILKERKEMFDYELSRFDSGLLFYYVSSTDERQHMFWRLIDKQHPMYDPKLAEEYGNTIENIYIEADKFLDKALQKTDKDTVLMVMSDHGFTSFRRSFNLNTWLKENGYHSLVNPWKPGIEGFDNTNWERTQAYALGINSLYINQRGREAEGIVNRGAEMDNLIYEIARKLEEFTDPETGERPVLKAYLSKEIYQGPYVNNAPDLIIGYNRGYRASWATPLGGIPENILEDNTQKWSGDHCMDPEVIPGIILTNKKIVSETPALYDLTATILQVFGIEKPKDMIGTSIF
ncbi:MAG: alkaline phosphatase family protein [Candidatus Aminicenantes bacterium]|nr:alkaline phosphatase family protein [Candidatus Aminicenantes bacterium]